MKAFDSKCYIEGFLFYLFVTRVLARKLKPMRFSGNLEIRVDHH